MESHRDIVKADNSSWLKKHIKYMQKINDLCTSTDAKAIEKAEEFCRVQSEWVLKEDPQLWVDCFKKFSNVEQQAKGQECTNAPFSSNKLLRMIMSKGKIQCSLQYLEYLTLKCNSTQATLHNELGCLYINFIFLKLKQYELSGSLSKEATEEAEVAPINEV